MDPKRAYLGRCYIGLVAKPESASDPASFASTTDTGMAGTSIDQEYDLIYGQILSQSVAGRRWGSSEWLLR